MCEMLCHIRYFKRPVIFVISVWGSATVRPSCWQKKKKQQATSVVVYCMWIAPVLWNQKAKSAQLRMCQRQQNPRAVTDFNGRVMETKENRNNQIKGEEGSWADECGQRWFVVNWTARYDRRRQALQECLCWECDAWGWKRQLHFRNYHGLLCVCNWTTVRYVVAVVTLPSA